VIIERDRVSKGISELEKRGKTWKAKFHSQKNEFQEQEKSDSLFHEIFLLLISVEEKRTRVGKGYLERELSRPTQSR